MSMSLRQIRYFLAAAEKGQVSLAAASLNVSQSTVTAALQQLEVDLGVSLFRRLPTGVELLPRSNTRAPRPESWNSTRC